MLYERLLDLAPEMRLERRLAERVAARLVMGLLLAIPVGAAAAAILFCGGVHALIVGICEAGLGAGAKLRDGIAAAAVLSR